LEGKQFAGNGTKDLFFFVLVTWVSVSYTEKRKEEIEQLF
jgi:hypothetical protein